MKRIKIEYVIYFLLLSCSDEQVNPSLNPFFFSDSTSAHLVISCEIDSFIINKPNIILIMADDIGVEAFSTYGGESYKTPNIDNMGKNGMVFNHCYSNPLCTPSRVKIMTGKYNVRNYSEFFVLKDGEYTFGSLFKDNGYKTSIVGKWQLAGGIKAPANFGFDDHCLWRIGYANGSRYWDPTIIKNGKYIKTEKNDYGPDIFLRHIKEYISQNKDSSFFLYYPMVLPHDPWIPAPPYKEDYENIESDPKYFSNNISYMDHIIGAILESIEKNGIGEKTLILFTSDNGTSPSIESIFRGNRVIGGKGGTKLNSTHVPLIAYWKGQIKSGSISNEIIDFSDFFATFSDLLSDDSEVVDGISFLPELFGYQCIRRDWTYSYYDPGINDYTKRTFIYNQRYKLFNDGSFFDMSESEDQKANHLTLEEERLLVKFSIILDSLNNLR